MFHANTERLLDYWRGQRAGRPAPARADIDPSGFAPLAPQVFMAMAVRGGDVCFRFAGEAVAALHGRPLGGESVLRLWIPEERGRLSRLLAGALASAEPLVLTAADHGPEGGRLEILFAPLAGRGGACDRFLGLHQPLLAPGVTPIAALSILVVNGLAESDRRAHLRLATLDGRLIA